MMKKLLSFVSKGNAYQSVTLWKRGSGATEMWKELYESNPELQEDLQIFGNIPADVDEIIAKIPAKYFDDEPIEKSISNTKVEKMNITEPEPEPVSISKQAAGDIAMTALHGIAENIRKANPSLTKEQAFLRAYSDPANAVLARAERNGHMDAIGADVGYATPVDKSATDGTDMYKRAKEIQAREGVSFETAISKAALPTMMSLKPRDLGDYSAGPAPGLDSDYPLTAEVERLAEEMMRAGSNGKGFDRAAAKYMAAQQRVEQAAREAGGVK